MHRKGKFGTGNLSTYCPSCGAWETPYDFGDPQRAAGLQRGDCIAAKGGRIIIDFNKAYNPLCAYSGGYRCPIPPLENHLSIRILAGELQYTGSLKERPEPLNNL